MKMIYVWIALKPNENVSFIEFFLPFPISLTLISCGTIASNLAGWTGFLFGNVYAPFQKSVSRDRCNKISNGEVFVLGLSVIQCY
jgi:hypothetical protein